MFGNHTALQIWLSCPLVPHGKHMGALVVASNFLPGTQLYSGDP